MRACAHTHVLTPDRNSCVLSALIQMTETTDTHFRISNLHFNLCYFLYCRGAGAELYSSRKLSINRTAVQIPLPFRGITGHFCPLDNADWVSSRAAAIFCPPTSSPRPSNATALIYLLLPLCVDLLPALLFQSRTPTFLLLLLLFQSQGTLTVHLGPVLQQLL